MAKARIYCEITCGRCGGLAVGVYYRNASTISRLKENVKDWIWSDEKACNLCPDCQEELKKNYKKRNKIWQNKRNFTTREVCV